MNLSVKKHLKGKTYLLENSWKSIVAQGKKYDIERSNYCSMLKAI